MQSISVAVVVITQHYQMSNPRACKSRSLKVCEQLNFRTTPDEDVPAIEGENHV